MKFSIKESPPKEYLYMGVGLLFGSLVFFVIQQLIFVPSEYRTFLGIPYAVNPEWVTAFYLRLLFQLLSVLFLGIGLLTLTLGVAKQMSKPSQSRRLESMKFCPFCGAKNMEKADYCVSCGKRLP